MNGASNASSAVSPPRLPPRNPRLDMPPPDIFGLCGVADLWTLGATRAAGDRAASLGAIAPDVFGPADSRDFPNSARRAYFLALSAHGSALLQSVFFSLHMARFLLPTRLAAPPAASPNPAPNPVNTLRRVVIGASNVPSQNACSTKVQASISVVIAAVS